MKTQVKHSLFKACKHFLQALSMSHHNGGILKQISNWYVIHDGMESVGMILHNIDFWDWRYSAVVIC